MRCQQCRADNSLASTFCGECGAQLRDEVVRATTPPLTDATRYLCAAVQLDTKVAERVVDEIVEERFRATPSSPGVDLAAVIHHALAARRRQLARDIALTLVVAALLLTLLSSDLVLLALLVLLGWLIVLGEQVVARYAVAAAQLGPGTFDPDAAPQPSDARLRHRIQELAARTQGNVTVYSGFDPFADHGLHVDAWSFAIDIRRAVDGARVQAFTAADLHDEVVAKAGHIGIGQIAVEERLFVDGRDLLGDRRFLHSDLSVPVAAVGAQLMRALVQQPEDRVRPYICCHVLGWSGQIVLSTFFRCLVVERHLVVEVTHTAMPPVKEAYQEVDRLLRVPTPGQLLRLSLTVAVRTPLMLVRAPRTVVRAAAGPWLAWRRLRRERREILAALRFDYGPTMNPRRLVSDTRYQRYFQQLDREQYAKVVEKGLLGAVIDFLDARGIDTSELTQRQTTILNQGVYITGGSSVSGSVAGGPDAQATSFIRQAAAAVRPAPRSSGKEASVR